MARNEHVIHASPSEVFGVLAEPRSYAYWVLGSREIRGADAAWPAPGSCFHHTVNIGPLRVKDSTEVEEAEPGRRLKLKARARPFGNARIEIALDELPDGTRVTMVEEAADVPSAFLFQPLTHLFVRRRNVRSLERLAELAEGRVRLPGDEPEGCDGSPGRWGAAVNPLLPGRAEARRRGAAAIARGALAGVAGALAMSASTNAEMRLRQRAPSDAPARTIERLLGMKIRGRRGRMRAAAAGHLVTSVALGAGRGAMDAADVPSAGAAAATFGLALVPEIVVVPALGAADPPWRWSLTETAISLGHHAVYAGTVVLAYERLRRR
jgi:Polyketide cyclase / dehydrase and lipid transport